MTPDHIRTILLLAALVGLAYLILRNQQNTKRNWALFYAVLYICATLPIVNYSSVTHGLWDFTDVSLPTLLIPFDILFLWVVSWGIIPVFFLSKRYFPIVLGFVIWIDILLMPALERMNILVLHDWWLIGEMALVAIVFIPGYVWAYASYHDRWPGLRAMLQVIVIICLYFVGLPFLLAQYGLIDGLHYVVDSLLLQLLLIIAFPGLVAVVDLVQIGKGTPFPYDKTHYLVSHGIYAYIRNPIQWSFALVSIPLTIYHGSWHLLVALPMSIFYSLSIADVQEYDDMENRFGAQWSTYKRSVPKWYFLWKPLAIPTAIVYLDSDCVHCSRLSSWFCNHHPLHLEIKSASDYAGTTLHKVTYVDCYGHASKGTKAIARSLEHINLAYATLGWFMRFPLVYYLLDAIVYSMNYEKKKAK